MTFHDVLMKCATTPEFVAEFDRLRGTNLSRSGSALELMIDDATRRIESDAALFIAFVHEHVWLPIAPAATSAIALVLEELAGEVGHG